MDTFGELIQAVMDDLSIDTNSPLYPPAVVKRAINRSKRKIEGAFRWPELEDVQKTSTRSGREYYDYPQNWRPDSIWKIWVDSNNNDFGKPLKFEDYLYECENDFPDGKYNIWSNQWRRYFIRIEKQIPSTNGNNNIVIFGLRIPDELEEDGDTTIWSYSMPEINEAVVLEAGAILKQKGNKLTDSQFLSTQAQALVIGARKRLREENAKEQKSRPMFDVPDFFRSRNKGRKDTNYGKF